MKWLIARVVFEHEDTQLAAELISDIFYELGVQGVIVETPEADPKADWADEPVSMPDTDAVTGYFPKNEQAAEKCSRLEEHLKRLAERNQIVAQIMYGEIDEEDWSESWKAHFWPEKVSDGMVVKPTWREYAPLEGEQVIELDPGMAFGTGTHGTTALCMRLIEKYLKPGDSILDVGTGSGILLIAARKCGAGELWGVDMDQMAVDVARDNLSRNGINGFELRTGNLVDVVDRRFDLVIANILSEVILSLLDNITDVMTENGIFICSGIIEGKEDRVIRKMETTGFQVLETQGLRGWAAIVGERIR